MWDLEQIIQRNNEAALEYMMRGQRVEAAQSPQPEAWSLSSLSDMLKAGPPLLTELMNCLSDISTRTKFQVLIMNLLPEHDAEIMAEPRRRRLYKFCYLFGKKHFPLPRYSSEMDLEEFVNGMPIDLMAMSYSAYHGLNMRPGYLLLLSLVIYPYEDDERDEYYAEDYGVEERGGRIPLLDLVREIIGTDLVSLIPSAGWQPSELHQMTDKTPYDGVGDFADWACSDTGCIVLDASYDNCDYIEGYGEPIFKWTKHNVEALTEQWSRVKQIRGKIDHLVEWLEADPRNKFQELLDFLLLCSKTLKKPKPKRYNDPFTPVLLEQVQDFEEDEDGE